MLLLASQEELAFIVNLEAQVISSNLERYCGIYFELRLENMQKKKLCCKYFFFNFLIKNSTGLTPEYYYKFSGKYLILEVKL